MKARASASVLILAAAFISLGMVTVVAAGRRGQGSAPIHSDWMDSASLESISVAQLRATSGTIEALDSSHSALRSPALRALIGGDFRSTVQMNFAYLGPTLYSAPLASGEMRRQVGIKLLAQDTCNVLYVMWHIEPGDGIQVSLKMNPGQNAHAQCRDRGYTRLFPTWSRADIPVIRAGTSHTLLARLDLEANTLHVEVDHAVVWIGKLPDSALKLRGPAGIRADNASLEVELRASRPVLPDQKP
ncbi:hypothetical protein [Sorangium sp. So ce363]|uniref:hypothetical protein n=1 Tax=Sorangium sp. So ce363 TaxID=3133304 RepID=UPI003F61C2F5